MSIVGYARVSSAGQDLDFQLAALKAAGCDVIRSEKVSGTSTEGRTELRTILDFVRKGDVLIVTRIDRLARSIAILLSSSGSLSPKARRSRRPSSDRHVYGGRPGVPQMSACSPSLRPHLRRERQLEGIAAAKRQGVYKGRPATIKAEDIAALKAEGLGRQRDREAPRDRPGQRLQGGRRSVLGAVRRRGQR